MLFPQFNLYSTPLLILVLQGVIFAFLLFAKFWNTNKMAYLFFGILLLVIAYHQIAYTIGFMGWYDTYQNTKINYALFSLDLAIGPLIYLFVRNTLVAPFQMKREDLWHFLPIAFIIVYRIAIFLHDRSQADWATGYEGEWLREVHVEYLAPILSHLEYSSQLLYLAFTIQLFWRHRKQIQEYFSNTFSLELNWMRNFIMIYCILFVVGYFFDAIDAYVFELDYVHRWWNHLLSSIVIVYLGIRAYMINLDQLHQKLSVGYEVDLKQIELPANAFAKEKDVIQKLFSENHLYLNPELTLKDLAEEAGMSMHQTSEVINSALGINFKELVNQFRVEEVKQRLSSGEFDHLSLVAIAMDSGFNSKATFNRVFKQQTGISPSEYRANHQK